MKWRKCKCVCTYNIRNRNNYNTHETLQNNSSHQLLLNFSLREFVQDASSSLSLSMTFGPLFIFGRLKEQNCVSHEYMHVTTVYIIDTMETLDQTHAATSNFVCISSDTSICLRYERSISLLWNAFTTLRVSYVSSFLLRLYFSRCEILFPSSFSHILFIRTFRLAPALMNRIRPRETFANSAGC